MCLLPYHASKPMALEVLLSRGGGLKFVLPCQYLGGEPHPCYHNIRHAYHALYFSISHLETAWQTQAFLY